MTNHEIPGEGTALQRFDEAEIESLAKLMTNAGLSELRLVRGTSSVHLQKAEPPSRFASPAPFPAAAAAGTAPSQQPPAPKENADASHAVQAPLYGIVHLTPAPDQPPFVQAGSRVRKGQTVALVEAMKTFHEVSARRSGIVVALHVSSGQEVQAGERLMELADDV